jgi:uncharacterized protein
MGLGLMVYTIQAQIPERPNPQRLVNDFADILNPSEERALERKLVNYNDTTSTQIAIVIISDLQNYNIAQFGTELAQKWGIGQKGKDNGILILIKEKKANSDGDANINVGYGLEEYVPDITARRIIEYEMLPFFREDRMYDGLDASTSSLMGLLSGEFTADQYDKRGADAGDAIGIIVFMVIIALFMFAGRSRRSQHGLSARASSFPWWIFLFSGGGRSSGSGWSDFSGGSGSFGGSDFGGFGGGGFGGGGASGSW